MKFKYEGLMVLMAENVTIIQSVDRAVAILDLVADAGQPGIGLKDISQKVGVNASTVHHLVATLISRQLIEQDPFSKRYRLGIHLIELGNAALSATSIARVAQPHLDRIWDQTGHTVTLLVVHGLLRTPLVGVRSRQMLVVNSAPLEVSTLHATGSGKLLLAYLPENEFQTYLGFTRLERFTGSTITDSNQLGEELARIRESGLSLDREEYGNGVCCISAPVQDATKRVVGCIDMVFPTFGINPEQFEQMKDCIRQTAKDFSIQLSDIGLVVS
jgi:IclR family transcriptional regulator, acetate operon repressor